MQTTLRKALDQVGFNWDAGQIILEPLHPDADSDHPGWAIEEDLGPRQLISVDDPRLDEVFNAGFGGPKMPRFVAWDHWYVFFPVQYDGSTSVQRVFRSPDSYRSILNEELPYPGG